MRAHQRKIKRAFNREGHEDKPAKDAKGKLRKSYNAEGAEGGPQRAAAEGAEKSCNRNVAKRGPERARRNNEDRFRNLLDTLTKARRFATACGTAALLLAVGAVVAAAACEHDAFDGCAADEAGFAFAAVNAML